MNFNGSWKCTHREGDDTIMREMQLPEDHIKKFCDDNLHPVYTFSIKDDKKTLDFIQLWPGQSTFLSQSATFNKDMFDDRPEVQAETGYSMVWSLDNDNELTHVFSQCDGNGDVGFRIVTKYELSEDRETIQGRTKSEGGARSSITLKRI